MNKVEGLEISHPRSDLSGHVDQGAKAQGPRPWWQWAAPLGKVAAEELVEIAVLQVLHGHEVGLLSGAETQDSGDVGVFQHGEQADLANKLRPGNKKKQEVNTPRNYIFSGQKKMLLLLSNRKYI